MSIISEIKRKGLESFEQINGNELTESVQQHMENQVFQMCSL